MSLILVRHGRVRFESCPPPGVRGRLLLMSWEELQSDRKRSTLRERRRLARFDALGEELGFSRSHLRRVLRHMIWAAGRPQCPTRLVLPAGHKKCPTCREVKPLDGFAGQKKKIYCAKCNRERVAANRAAKREAGETSIARVEPEAWKKAA